MDNNLYEQGKELIRAAPQLYVDLDVEADGKPGHGSLLSIGAVTPWGDEFYAELKPTSSVWVQSQKDFCEAHNLKRERLLQEGTEPAEAIQKLGEWTLSQQARHKKSGAVLTAFNASFDYPWIDLEATKAGIKSPFGIAGYCIKSLALALSKNCDWRTTTKGNLPNDIVPSGDFTHNALEDAKYQQKIHFALIGKLSLLQSRQH
jgi:DNA polymerase III alpha subunit (gram-positive type)